MPFTQGTSVAGRQLLGTVTGNETRVYVNIRTAGLVNMEFKGVLALEYVGTPYPFQLWHENYYPQAMVYEHGVPFTLDTQIVCYWRKSGLLWRAEWE